jgi:hypothetical protein
VEIKQLYQMTIERWLVITLISAFFYAEFGKIRGKFTEKYNNLLIYLFCYINNSIFASHFMNFTLYNI